MPHSPRGALAARAVGSTRGFRCLVFALLYLHAYRKREELELNELEVFDTRAGLVSAVLMGAVGVASLVITLLFGTRAGGWSGWIYLANGPIQTIQGFWFGSRRRRLETLAG